ncbi:hypothetical protein N7447_004168 [Penicillium robsamsonii]|uniref:uncharacterized protein n=1 Tax=Penicillium robsamsonii TaxID=1792511 RepID=UPI002546C13B|nr:uncharacterized protein N7447_004168 [Penicillium robsamsonii]KAJ5827405.1 hypothetical protein N7447_004168 [Penicillium robsamsonii]
MDQESLSHSVNLPAYQDAIPHFWKSHFIVMKLSPLGLGPASNAARSSSIGQKLKMDPAQEF